MKRVLIAACVAALALASPAWAGFDVELDAAAAYNYGGSCSATGDHGARTVPRCTGTADGTFYLRYFTRVLPGAATFTAQSIRFTNETEPDATAAACFNIACTATTPGADSDTVTFNAGVTKTIDLDAATDCDQIAEECHSTAFTSGTAIRNLQTGADCASTTCNNSELICRITYLGTTGTGCTGSDDDDLDISSLKLTVE